MKVRWYGWLTLVAILALIINVYAFAGLGKVSGVGHAVTHQARLESPLKYTYLVAGDYAWRYTPVLRGMSSQLASATWGSAYPAIRQNPDLALIQLDRASRGVMHGLMVLVYWLPLLLFPIALVGWLRRPRQVSLMGGGGS